MIPPQQQRLGTPFYQFFGKVTADSPIGPVYQGMMTMKVSLQEISPSQIDVNRPLFPFSPIDLAPQVAPWWLILEGEHLRPLGRVEMRDEPIVALVFAENSSLIELWEQAASRLIQLDRLSAWDFINSYHLLAGQCLEPPVEKAMELGKALKLEGRWFKQKKYKVILEEETSIRSFCDLQRLSFREMKNLSLWNPEELKELGDFFKFMQLKGNRLQSLLEPLHEIKKKEGWALKGILSRLTGPAEAARELEALKNPQLNQHRESLKTLSQSFSKQIQLELDPWFEKDQLSIHLMAGNSAEFEERLGELQQALADGRAQKLFDLI